MLNGQVLKDKAVAVTIGGTEHKVRLSLWGLILAEEEHGYDISDLDLDKDGAESRKGNLRRMLELLWIGMLPFEPDLTLSALGQQVGFGDMAALTEAFNKVVKLQLTDDIRGAASDSKKKSGPKT